MYQLGNFMLGMGFMFNHYNSSISYGQQLKLFDFKTGFLFGYQKEESEFKIKLYPRFLPHDTENSSKPYTLDVDGMSLGYTYTVSSTLKYYTIMSARGFYVFDHATPQSNYWGVDEIGLGVTLGGLTKSTGDFNLSLTIEYLQKFYFEDLNNDKPYSIVPNGQGWFGMNFSKWLEGDPFSGFSALTSQLSVKVEEQIIKHLFLYQKVIIEIGDLNADHHEFNFQIGVGGMY